MFHFEHSRHTNSYLLFVQHFVSKSIHSSSAPPSRLQTLYSSEAVRPNVLPSVSREEARERRRAARIDLFYESNWEGGVQK